MGILAALLLTGIFIYLKNNSQDTFFESRIKNPDSYLLDINQMTGTDTHTLKLEKENTLKIQFEKEKGQLKLEIKAPDGTAVYEGNGDHPQKSRYENAAKEMDALLGIPHKEFRSIQCKQGTYRN